jgi:dTDP-4-dehydrorhamnose reductase
MINQDLEGVFHLGSKDLIHHIDLIGDICKRLNFQNPLLKKVFSSNEDRFLAVLPKDNLLPQNLQIDIEQIVEESILL